MKKNIIRYFSKNVNDILHDTTRRDFITVRIIHTSFTPVSSPLPQLLNDNLLDALCDEISICVLLGIMNCHSIFVQVRHIQTQDLKKLSSLHMCCYVHGTLIGTATSYWVLNTNLFYIHSLCFW